VRERGQTEANASGIRAKDRIERKLGGAPTRVENPITRIEIEIAVVHTARAVEHHEHVGLDQGGLKLRVAT
jgi:hypothetical protein